MDWIILIVIFQINKAASAESLINVEICGLFRDCTSKVSAEE